MKTETAELTGLALDWAVAKIELEHVDWFNPSTTWARGGPIIERERICINCCTHLNEWAAGDVFDKTSYGPTPLIAAMRCFVASKLGNEVDVPEELT